jgi:release factor glutamine methyltransferase
MEVKSNRIGDVRHFYRQKLSKLYPEREADTLVFMLISEYTGLTRAEILIRPEEPNSESQLLKIHFGVKALLNHKPIQYILGKAEFFGLTLKVTPDVLIPRPETEELVDWIIKEESGTAVSSILDIGTGSGCIAIVLQKHFGKAQTDAIDISEAGLALAKINARSQNAAVNFRKIDFINTEKWESFGEYDLVVSNPPYVRESEKIRMKKNVLHYEPDAALFVSDDDPLLFYHHIARFCKAHLSSKGVLFCEINQYLSKETAQMFEQYGFCQVELKKDLFGNYRFIKCSDLSFPKTVDNFRR